MRSGAVSLVSALVASAGIGASAGQPIVMSSSLANVTDGLVNATAGNLSWYGLEIIEGILEGFLHSDENLTATERSCVVSAVGSTAVNAWEASWNMVNVMQELRQKRINPAVQAAELTQTLAASSYGVVALATPYISNCSHGPAAQSIVEAAQHLQSMRYVAGGLMANGADVMMELTAATDAVVHHQHRVFGNDIGRACRKVLLSGKGAKLPEAPTVPQLANVSEGLIEGFFGPGSTLLLPPSNLPLFGPWSDGGDVKFMKPPAFASKGLKIDLHACVEKNRAYFESVMTGVWLFFAQNDPMWQRELHSDEEPAVFPRLLWGLPKALRRCGIDEVQEQMLMESIMAPLMTHGIASLTLPSHDDKMTTEKMLRELKDACEDWSQKKWHAFGGDLGKMLRRLVMGVFPQKYSVDQAGRLQRSEVLADVRTNRGGFPLSTLLIAAFPLLLVAVAFITRRGGNPRRALRHEETGMESNLLVE
eukprot:CAMPEP_0195104264 /NCGR_PEP_ID=MMETSP0448-20130528/72994_1 /TAXON_ID=66468 /ORGANISM="Heterocapsa triquestra, Strain CCMP 448" /LENGTH=477 /DNA_ID=CAMNT_0040140071 /DNA_START=63 /DNA_END=1496 /DNA_ORIENTATION=-